MPIKIHKKKSPENASKVIKIKCKIQKWYKYEILIYNDHHLYPKISVILYIVSACSMIDGNFSSGNSKLWNFSLRKLYNCEF